MPEQNQQGLTYRQVNTELMETIKSPGPLYYLAVLLAFAGVLVGVYSWWLQIYYGMGVTSLNNPVGWGIYITNFVFWVGIAHSGTLISAILFLVRAKWRTAIYRSAEAMTVFAVMTAGLFPLIHLGRVWRFYYLLPYPSERLLWPNFRSPLLWDVFAVLTYLTVSSMFLYLGMIPDLAAYRDHYKGWRQKLYRVLSLAWRGTNRQWKHYSGAYAFFAALATPLVISVHSIVSWDFAMSILPGWHSTIFAPYFVAGAIHSGLSTVLIILIPMRKIFRLHKFIKIEHFENIAKLIILTGLIVGYAYVTELSVAWYSANQFEQGLFLYRLYGDYAPLMWVMILFNSILPLAFFIRNVRRNILALFGISVLVNIGMWSERFVIIVTSLGHAFIPYAWGTYQTSWVELGITVGAFSWFSFLFLIFVKMFPVISIAEVKEALPRPGKASAV
ncbi:MAG: NrfD/PsrC family molybdoenzyme membrane anchor subunit [Acidobacteriota bacterium]